MKNIPLLFCILTLLLLEHITFAQAPHVQWQRVSGNGAGDYPKKILQTADGGYIVAGSREGNITPTGPNSAFVDNFISVSKYDASGELQWENSLIMAAQNMVDMVLTRDGGYLVVTSAFIQECDGPNDADIFAIRINAAGEVLWKKHYGSPLTDEGHSVDITPDGDYIIAGATQADGRNVIYYHGGEFDAWAIKINDAGDLLWQRALGGPKIDIAYDVAVAADGSAVVVGYTEANGGTVTGLKGPRDAWAVKLSSNGTLVWQRCLGGSMYETANSVTLSHSGGFILAIQANSNDGDVTGLHNTLGAFADFWIVDISSSGNINWSKCYGGQFNEQPFDIQKTNDGGYVVAGSAESSNGDVTCNKGSEDMWLIKISNNGSLQWQKSFGGELYDMAFSVQQLADNSFILAGQTCSRDIAGYHPVEIPAYSTCADYLLIKLSAQGVPVPAPTLTINPTNAEVCSGIPVTLFAKALNAGVNTTFQWTKNGQPVGSNSPYYTTSDLQANDAIRYTITSQGSCDAGGQVVSDEIRIRMKASSPLPAISISASTNVLCNCQPVSFRATVNNMGLRPVYTWKLNGRKMWSSLAVLTLDMLQPGDVVICEYSDESICFGADKLVSNSIQFAGGNGDGVASVNISSNNVCEGERVRIDAIVINGGLNPVYKWTVNGSVVGTNSDSLILTSPASGDRVQCTVTVDPQMNCVQSSEAISQELVIQVMPRNYPSVHLDAITYEVCEGQEVELSADATGVGNAATYEWMINGTSSGVMGAGFKSRSISDSDQISILVTPGNDVCDVSPIQSSPVTIRVHPVPNVHISPADTIVARGAEVQLNASIEGNYSSFLWQPAEFIRDVNSLSTATIPLRQPLQVALNVTTHQGCSTLALANINVRTALYMANAFSPNNDGLNDLFRIPEGTTLDLAEFSVYDRWGNRIFTTKDIARGWDGRVNGKPADTGTYIFFIKGSDDKGIVMQKGIVTLVR
jgi:gliding motility-associated-like protein